MKSSKFAIFLLYENPKLIFPFFISCYFIIFLMNALGLSMTTYTMAFIREKIKYLIRIRLFAIQRYS